MEPGPQRHVRRGERVRRHARRRAHGAAAQHRRHALVGVASVGREVLRIGIDRGPLLGAGRTLDQLVIIPGDGTNGSAHRTSHATHRGTCGGTARHTAGGTTHHCPYALRHRAVFAVRSNRLAQILVVFHVISLRRKICCFAPPLWCARATQDRRLGANAHRKGPLGACRGVGGVAHG